MVDQNWVYASGSPALRIQFAYDADSNVLYALNQSTGGSGQSQLFGPNAIAASVAYDLLGRRRQYRGGTLVASSPGSRLNTIDPAAAVQEWLTDDKGNSRRKLSSDEGRPIVQDRQGVGSAAVVQRHVDAQYDSKGDKLAPHPRQALSSSLTPGAI